MLRRPRVFCASLADWLDDEVRIEWLADLLKLIHDTPNLDWLLLTKRPQNWYFRLRDALAHIEGIDPVTGWDSVDPLSPLGDWLNEWLGGNEIPANIWIGTTVEDQARADQRIPQLLNIPARVRFLSCEPLLESVSIPNSVINWNNFEGGINWVICGGESGPGARPMHPAWARRLRDDCQHAGVSFFFKQWGEWKPTDGDGSLTFDSEGRNCSYYDPGAERMVKVGKHYAGRLLDGREWNEFPAVEATR